MKPGVWMPPPTEPASVENPMPPGARELAVDHHHAVGLGDHRQDALEASAGGHRGVHDRVEVEAGDGVAGMLADERVHAVPRPLDGVERGALLYWLGRGGRGGSGCRPLLWKDT